jgi:hypothetical protein
MECFSRNRERTTRNFKNSKIQKLVFTELPFHRFIPNIPNFPTVSCFVDCWTIQTPCSSFNRSFSNTRKPSMIDDFDEVDGNDCEYFIEPLLKNRIKQKGHSYRRNVWTLTHSAVTLERSGGHSKSNSQLQEVAVSEIDNYFDSGFWSESRYNFSYRQPDRPLNTPDRWEEVEEALGANATKITKEFSRSEGHCKTHYDVPVSGHVLCQKMTTLTEDRRTGWLFWQGKYYDPNYLYLKEDTRNNSNGHDHFIRLCSLVRGHNDPAVELGRINAKLNRIAKGAFYLSRRKKNKQYLEFDLGKICLLTHIGTLGGYPRQHLDIFPPAERDEHCRNRTRSAHIYIVNSEHHLAWVTKYLVHYRDPVSGKWKVYENPLNGNSDIGTEVTHPVSILTRHLRIIPLDFQHRKEMRVMVYGDPIQNQKLSQDGNVGDATRLNTEVEEEIPTIRYTLHPVSSRNVCQSTYRGCGKGCEICNPTPNPVSRRRNFRKLVEHELEMILDDKNLCNIKVNF